MKTGTKIGCRKMSSVAQNTLFEGRESGGSL